MWWCSIFLSFSPLMFPFKRDIKNRNINLADGAIGLLAGICTLCCRVADLHLHAGAPRDALALLQALPSSSSRSLLRFPVLGEPSGAEGAPAGSSSSCSQVALISDSSEPSPKGGELVFALIAARFDGSGSSTCVGHYFYRGVAEPQS